jgi:hypothetical protein
MRLWSVHPQYLDAKGLVALWREGLLAKAVLSGKTQGYRAHPQLVRFREHERPLDAINAFLAGVLHEAQARGYRFDARKIDPTAAASPIPVTVGQLHYEWAHLLRKLHTRAPEAARLLTAVEHPEPHPLFFLVEGPIAPWEVVPAGK